MMRFACPEAFFLLILPLLVYYILPPVKRMYGEALRIPFITDLQMIKEKAGGKNGLFKADSLSSLRLLILTAVWCLLTVALARPQQVGNPLPVQNESRDILLVIDISNSMNEIDFEYKNRMYDRLSAVKNVAASFADSRTSDRIGLVLFGTRAYLQVPLTYDKQSLKDVLLETDAGMAGDSTSIGDAVGVALKNLAAENDKKANKVIILLTDGENNDGSLSLPQAVALAKEENVKVYTIGVGSDSMSFFGGLFSVPKNSGLDEKGLKELASETAGRYFRAKDVSSLQKIYAEIDKLEPQKSQGRFVQEIKELYYYPAGAALLLFFVLAVFIRKVR